MLLIAKPKDYSFKKFNNLEVVIGNITQQSALFISRFINLIRSESFELLVKPVGLCPLIIILFTGSTNSLGIDLRLSVYANTITAKWTENSKARSCFA